MAERVPIGNGFVVGLGVPKRDGDVVVFRGLLAKDGKQVGGVLEFRHLDAFNIEMTMDGEPWAPPRGTSHWELSKAISSLASVVHLGD